MDGFLIAIGLVCFGLCFDNAIGNLARVIGMAAEIIAAKEE